MAKVAVPIIKLTYNPRDAYPNAIHEIFLEEKAWDDSDEFTFTGGVSIPLESTDCEARRERIRVKLKALFIRHYGQEHHEEPLKLLLELLDSNNWDVSFYVDCF